MTMATWVAAHTVRLRIGQLVLCDAFRHPAVLAKQAVTLQEAAGGRFELGLGENAQAPPPALPIPLALGGVGAPMLELVRKYATWRTKRRFGDHVGNGLVCGDVEQLVAHFTDLTRRGVERRRRAGR
jgi:hypothetical protein